MQLLNLKTRPHKQATVRGSLLLIALHLSACAATQSADFSVVYEHNQCGYTDPAIIALDSEQKHAAAVSKLLPFNTDADKTRLQQRLQSEQAEAALYLVAQGHKPTPGYGFDIQAEQALIDDSVLRLPIRFSQPEAGRMLAQVMTSPCVILGVDKNAKYKRIEVESLYLDTRQ